MESENNCYFVCSRGILKSCDIFSLNPKSSSYNLINYNSDISNNDDYKIIYICNEAIDNFIKYKINYKYILISGDSDNTISNNEILLKFIENDNLIHWYSQNCTIVHPKITKIPIGLDYHTIFSHNNHEWGNKMSPLKQEEMLKNIISSNKPFYERYIKCYSNFHFSMNTLFGYDRKDALNQTPHNLVFYEPNTISREQSWKNQSEYAFVISPHGNGLDCHRTWEALVLGCIPIVKTSDIDSLYYELPVLIVKNWTDITYELLENTILKFKYTYFNYDKLTLKYYVNKFKSHKIL